MYNILLACAGGMSTSMLVSKMKDYAEGANIDANIDAVAESRIDELIDLYDVVLLGPQITYMEEELKEKYKNKGKPIEVIDQMDYALIDGEKVFNMAINLIKGVEE